nr:immunoglobulin light chain junction region [Macaca mulatta]MOW51548.1 immunoglobulin light chain junction region [Macaca mulatta]MOW51608.1 immunoglobulin light chain junction region [Macaca mulatta]MOW51620.1 immunoglobulin light chain junction region [Macaca mulatta]MOW51653.1 immunoglobulin light chain junction region [Macaca mulatta]
CMQAREFPWSF